MKAVLFDFYDTLAHLEPAPVQAGRRELARRAGVAETALQPLWRATSRERMLGTAGDLATQITEMLSTLGAPPTPELLADLVEHEEAGLATSGAALRRHPVARCASCASAAFDSA